MTALNNPSMDCFFTEKLPHVFCCEERTTFSELLDRSVYSSDDCRSDLEHFLLLAGCFDSQLRGICSYSLCDNHRNFLLNSRRRKNNCLLCVDVFNRKKRSVSDLRKISKRLAIRIWHVEGLNVYNGWMCSLCRKTCAIEFAVADDDEDAFQWLYDERILDTPSSVGYSLPQWDDEYEPSVAEISPAKDTNWKPELRRWLASTGYNGRCRSTENYQSMNRHDKCGFLRQIKSIFSHILQRLAPNDSEAIWEDFIYEETRKPTQVKNIDYGTIISSLVDAYARAEHWSTKRQLLSIIAADLPVSLLKAEFPNMTDWKIKVARAHAYFEGRGTILDISRTPVERFTRDQLAHFILFIQSPHIITDMPFGERKLTLSDGKQLCVPDVIRNAIPSRIISQYLAYCNEAENDGSFKPLASSSLFKILECCSASTRKSLAGLDNFSSDGSNAFDQLRRLCDEFAIIGLKAEDVIRLKKSLHDTRNYLKLDYKTHISTSNSVADHCSTYALSDANNSVWRQQCQHEHNDQCADCTNMRVTLSEIQSIIEQHIGIDNEMRNRMLYRFHYNAQLIEDWKKHLLRTVHQDAARHNVLQLLDDSNIFLVADWAMKWLPVRYRESQRDFFGKRGLPWHITYAIRVDPTSASSSTTTQRRFQHRTFCHVFDNVRQDGHAVVSILCDVLKHLKQSNPNLSAAFIRTDNAGCYKGSDTLLAVQQIYTETGILIRRFDFSDAQSGKGACDRMAAVIKGNIHRFINEKNDCVTSSDFVAGARITKNLSVIACRLSESRSTKKLRWHGIHNFNNLQYELIFSDNNNHSRQDSGEIRIIVWRAFAVGSGRRFDLSRVGSPSESIGQIHVGAQHENSTWQTDAIVEDLIMADANNSYDQNRSKGDGNGNVIDKSSGFVTFDCPEPHCVMEFRREDRLRAHLLMGAHKTQETSHRLLDNAMLMYSESINHHDHVQVPNISADTSTGLYSQIPSNNLDEGWALHRSRTRAPFSVSQRSFMEQKYNEGERSGAKWDADSVAEEMQILKNNDGFIFQPEEFLSTSQIKSYFSRLTRERRRRGNESQPSTNGPGTLVSFDDESIQQQKEEDESDFDSSLVSLQTHNILDNAIHILNDILKEQESNENTSMDASPN